LRQPEGRRRADHAAAHHHRVIPILRCLHIGYVFCVNARHPTRHGVLRSVPDFRFGFRLRAIFPRAGHNGGK
ncbi:hypothetical protein, partial [Serratia marcescens]|uniref:hypothetical protein n=2 Tax=Serratia marcescens TaxID=615 RepID=UPI00197EE33A